jgi:hypothetical protein
VPICIIKWGPRYLDYLAIYVPVFGLPGGNRLKVRQYSGFKTGNQSASTGMDARPVQSLLCGIARLMLITPDPQRQSRGLGPVTSAIIAYQYRQQGEKRLTGFLYRRK